MSSVRTAAVEHVLLTAEIADDDAAHEDELPRTRLSGGWSSRARVLPVAALGLVAVIAVASRSGHILTTSMGFRHELVSEVGETAWADPPCLCVFDIDRTLTGKQGWAGQCENNKEMPGVQDQAYSQGTLLLSQIGQGMESTFCGSCKTGIVTAGIASGKRSSERVEILKAVGGTSHTYMDWWQDIKFNPNADIKSSLVLQALDGSKQNAVRGMVNWWRANHQIDFADENVWFFDDIAGNVAAFKGSGFNARQVSCDVPRGPAENFPGQFDGKTGGCGGIFSEIVNTTGVHTCTPVNAPSR